MDQNLSTMTVPQLKVALKEAGVTGYSKLNKPDLIKALQKARGETENTEKDTTSKKRARDESSEESGEEGSSSSEVEKPTKKLKTDSSPISKRYGDYLTDPGWKEFLKEELEKSYFKEIEKFVGEQRKVTTVYPPEEEVFNAFNYTPIDKVRIVIIGQDPYFNEGEAHGICFSVKKGKAIPKSLGRMYKVLEKTVPGFKAPNHGCLEEWARRGVLMLNATLTVAKGKANSHSKCGWTTFTNAVIDKLNKTKSGLIFLLWGKFAVGVGKNIDLQKHHVLEGSHPSPLAGDGWNDCTHFVDANKILKENGFEEIDWTIS